LYGKHGQMFEAMLKLFRANYSVIQTSGDHSYIFIKTTASGLQKS